MIPPQKYLNRAEPNQTKPYQNSPRNKKGGRRGGKDLLYIIKVSAEMMMARPGQARHRGMYHKDQRIDRKKEVSPSNPCNVVSLLSPFSPPYHAVFNECSPPIHPSIHSYLVVPASLRLSKKRLVYCSHRQQNHSSDLSLKRFIRLRRASSVAAGGLARRRLLSVGRPFALDAMLQDPRVLLYGVEW